VTIKPAIGITTSISGDNTSAIIKLNGADFVTIDGSNAVSGTSKDLTISNTNAGTTASVIWIASATASDGATNNTIKNCVVTGNASTTTLMDIFSGGTASVSTTGNALTANSNNTIQNNRISKAQYGIFLLGTSTTTLDASNQIMSNALGSSTSGDGFSTNGILVQNQTGCSISGNDVQNVIGTGGLLDIAGSSTVLTGIYLRQTKLSIVNANQVHSINYNGASTIRQHAISLESPAFSTSGAQSQNVVSNNFVYGNTYAGGGSVWTVSGINTNGGYGDGYYYNSVYMTGTLNATAGPAAAFSNGNASTTTAALNINVRNNIFYINGTSTSSATFYAHYTTATTYSGSVLNNNDLLTTATSPQPVKSDF
jgi:parallel beta-helix repeat protein